MRMILKEKDLTMLTLNLFKSFTAVDIETTGLEKEAEIIEIGLAHYENGKCIKTWQKLIKPIHPIKHDITLLTGITNNMLIHEPEWEDITKEFLEEIDGKILLAHNKSFDKSHLEYHLGFELINTWLDTYDLAKILLPHNTSYKLQVLAQVLGISDNNHHRALNDALVCGEVYLKLLDKGQNNSPFVLAELASYLKNTEATLSNLLDALSTESASDDSPLFDYIESFEENAEDSPLISFKNSTEFFKKDGLLSQSLPSFEYRSEQVQMQETIMTAFLEKKHAIIEAGTGTGKSFSYLVPSLLYAFENEQKVIVSTNTMTLQEQLFKNDLPFLKETLDYPFKVTISKGRNNYLCNRRFNDLLKDSSLSKDEKLFLSGLMLWQENTHFGDKEELNLNNLEKQFWNRVASTTDTCINKACPYFMDCYFFNNRRKAQDSQLIIVNHALLLQHIKTNHAILPEAHQVIVDEAHHLEDETIKQFTTTIELEKLRKQVNTLIKKRGLLEKIKKQIELNETSKEDKENLFDLLTNLEAFGLSTQDLALDVITLANLIPLLANNGEVRLTQKYRESDWWKELKEKLTVFKSYLHSFNKKLKQLLVHLEDNPDYDTIYREIDYIFTLSQTDLEALETFLSGENENLVYWMSAQTNTWGNNLFLYLAYIDVAPIMREKLFEHYDSVILTSATLNTSNGLDYIAQNYLLEKNDYVSFICLSPFDYEKQSLVATLTHRPDYSKVNELTYSKHVAEDLETLIPSVNGGILILFTSYAMMNRVAYSLKESKALKEYTILVHGQDGNRTSMIEVLKSSPNVIVLGAASFWEGIDVTGDSLKAVIITKLPFSPPTMPIESARAEFLEKNGKSAFNHLSLPKAILRFRQGIGRLIRSKSDKGVIIILDNRITRKAYGKAFLKALPKQSHITGDAIDVAFKISSWLKN